MHGQYFKLSINSVLDVASQVACPARFERATYALEGKKFDYFNCVFKRLDPVQSDLVFAVNYWYLMALNSSYMA